jgi:hypothetical protein
MANSPLAERGEHHENPRDILLGKWDRIRL